MYDKFAGFVADFSEIGRRLSSAQVAYETAHGKLAIGRGNLVRASEQLKRLGVMPSKTLPQSLVEIADDREPGISGAEVTLDAQSAAASAPT